MWIRIGAVVVASRGLSDGGRGKRCEPRGRQHGYVVLTRRDKLSTALAMDALEALRPWVRISAQKIMAPHSTYSFHSSKNTIHSFNMIFALFLYRLHASHCPVALSFLETTLGPRPLRRPRGDVYGDGRPPGAAAQAAGPGPVAVVGDARTVTAAPMSVR